MDSTIHNCPSVGVRNQNARQSECAMGGAYMSIQFIDSTIHNHGADVRRNVLARRSRQMGDGGQKMENSPRPCLVRLWENYG